MQTFTEEMLVESAGNKWVLKRAFHFYYLTKTGGQINVSVPEGFVTDFASTPTILYPIFPPIGLYNKAAMMHDYLYASINPLISRKQADQFFLQAMEILKVPRWKRSLMFYAVRLFGNKHFKT